MKMIRISAVYVAAILMFAFINCGTPAKKQALVTFYAGNVTLRGADGVMRAVKQQQIIKDGDSIETGDRSYAIIQDNELIVRIESNTKAVISKISGIAEREIKLESGKVISKVEKLGKNNNYSVRTPTIVASVRGTEFITEFREDRSVVAVGNGRVSVIRGDTKEERFAEKGRSVVVAEKTVERALNQVETLELKKLEKTPVVKDPDKMKTDQMYRLFEEMIKADEKINEEIERLSGMSFEDIRTKYNRIDYIKMYNGKIIKGVILSRGTSMRVLTPEGIISVNTKDVKRTGTL